MLSGFFFRKLTAFQVLAIITGLISPVYAITWPLPPEGELPGGKLGSMIYTDTTNTRLGIYTRAPQGKFLIQKEAEAATGLISATGTSVSGTGTVFVTELKIGDQITVDGETRVITNITDNENLAINSSFPLDFTDEAFERSESMFIILNDGNIGLGETFPQNKLDVSGPVVIGISYSGVKVAPTNGLLVEGSVGIGTDTPQSKLDIEGGAIIGSSYSGSSAAPTEGLLVEGSVGIGTDVPKNKVDVEGNMAVGSNYSGSSTAPENGAIIEGTVGIGTDDPRSKVQIDGTDALRIPVGTTAQRPATELTGQIRFNSELQTYEGYGTNTWGSLGGSIDIDQDTQIHVEKGGPGTDEDKIRFDTIGLERMIIDTNGNVGINTSLPEGKLQIQGDTTTGTGTISSVGVHVTGDTTAFTTELEVGAQVIAAGEVRSVVSITDDTHLTLSAAFSSDITAETFNTALTRFQVQENGDTLINGNLEVTGTMDLTGSTTFTGQITTNGGILTGNNIVSDTDSTDNLGSDTVRFATTYSDNLVGETIDLDGTTGSNILSITDNVADGLSITDGADDIIVVDTTTGTESINITPDTNISGTLETTGLTTTQSGITTGADIISDTDSTDNLGSDTVRFATTYSDNLVGENIDLDGTTGSNILSITDNVADGLSITDGTDDIIVVTTTTGSESVNITPDTNITGNVDITGNTTTDGTVTFNNVTESTTKDTGAVILEGGLGVEKNINLGGNIDYTVGDHSIATGIGNNTFTVGGATTEVLVPGDFVVQGTTTAINTTDLDITDRNITVNVNGNNTSTLGAGVLVEGGATGGEVAGYYRVDDADNANLEIKAPTGSELTLDIDADTTVKITGTEITVQSDIISDTDSTDDLGSTLIRWLNAFIDTITTNKVIFDGDTGINEITISDNKTDGLSITDGTDDIIVITTTTGSESVNITPDTNISGDLDVSGSIKATGGLIIENRDTDPGTPASGQLWLRTDL